MSLASIIVDEPYKYKNGQEVHNWDNIYIGPTTVRYAIEHSMNVCAVRTLTEVVGEEKGYEYLLDFGFTTLTEEDRTSQAKALGGITNGVYNIELTAAYAAIANGGVYTEPILYTQVLDHDGNVLLDNSTPDTHEVIKDSTAYLLTSAMEDVINQEQVLPPGLTTCMLPARPVPHRTAPTSGFQHTHRITPLLSGADMTATSRWKV